MELDASGRVGKAHLMPSSAAGVRWASLFSSPFFHPTVLVERAVLERNKLRYDTKFEESEDYDLWSRVLEVAEGSNLAEPLVYYRVGDGAYARRGGMGLLRSELALQRQFRSLGLTTRRQYLRNVAVRGGYRLVPEGVRKVAYRRLLANRTGTPRR